jgi:hypothetical protein
MEHLERAILIIGNGWGSIEIYSPHISKRDVDTHFSVATLVGLVAGGYPPVAVHIPTLYLLARRRNGSA